VIRKIVNYYYSSKTKSGSRFTLKKPIRYEVARGGDMSLFLFSTRSTKLKERLKRSSKDFFLPYRTPTLKPKAWETV